MKERKIFIHNLELSASIGVYENEKKNKQKIIINLEILLTNNSEPKVDDLKETQDYSQYRNEVKKIVESQHYELLEILANKIHSSLMEKKFVLTMEKVIWRKTGVIPFLKHMFGCKVTIFQKVVFLLSHL